MSLAQARPVMINHHTSIVVHVYLSSIVVLHSSIVVHVYLSSIVVLHTSIVVHVYLSSIVVHVYFSSIVVLHSSIVVLLPCIVVGIASMGMLHNPQTATTLHINDHLKPIS